MLIRSVTLTDAQEILSIYQPYIEKTVITFETEVPSLEEFKDRIDGLRQDLPYLVAEEEGQVVAYAYAHPYYGRDAYAWTAETSIYVKQSHLGKGIGRALYLALEEALKEVGICQLLACIALPNPASIGIHQALGYETVGHFKNVGYKMGRWVDIVWMQKTLDEPAKPIPLLYKGPDL